MAARKIKQKAEEFTEEYVHDPDMIDPSLIADLHSLDTSKTRKSTWNNPLGIPNPATPVLPKASFIGDEPERWDDLEDKTNGRKRSNKDRDFPIFDRRRKSKIMQNQRKGVPRDDGGDLESEKFPTRIPTIIYDLQEDAQSAKSPSLQILAQSPLESQAQTPAEQNSLQSSHQSPSKIPAQTSVVKRKGEFQKTVLLLDPKMLDDQPHLSIEPDADLGIKQKSSMKFGKATRGLIERQSNSQPHGKILLLDDPIPVTLTGTKFGHKILKLKTVKREVVEKVDLSHSKNDTTELDLFLAEQALLLAANSIIATPATTDTKPNSPDTDTGIYHEVNDVDAIIRHFASILATRKRNLQLGLNVQTAITPLSEFYKAELALAEAVEHAANLAAAALIQAEVVAVVPTVESVVEEKAVVAPPFVDLAKLEIDNQVTVQYGLNTEPINSFNEDLMLETVKLPRLPNSARIRFANNLAGAVSIRSIKSATINRSGTMTRATTASSNHDSSTSCTCTDSSCSFCYSRSRADSRSTHSSIKEEEKDFLGQDTDDIREKSSSLKYAKYVSDDPWGMISLLSDEIANIPKPLNITVPKV